LMGTPAALMPPEMSAVATATAARKLQAGLVGAGEGSGAPDKLRSKPAKAWCICGCRWRALHRCVHVHVCHTHTLCLLDIPRRLPDIGDGI
jgi:hypothetical protein